MSSVVQVAKTENDISVKISSIVAIDTQYQSVLMKSRMKIRENEAQALYLTSEKPVSALFAMQK